MSKPSQSPTSSRRDFLARALKAAATIAAAGAAGYRFWDSAGPAAAPRATALTGLPDFSIPELAGKMSIATGKNRARTLNAALDALGGMPAFIKPRDRVLLKVNAAFATPPILGATTHPELVAEAVRLCRAAGAEFVGVTDNPINDPASCFRLSGIAAAAEAAGARVILPAERLFKPVSLPGGRLIRDWPFLHGAFEGVTKLIGLAPVKHHHRAGASLALKNWYGFLGGRRNVFHQDVHDLVKELAVLVKPTLVVLDGTSSMVRNGPTGGSLSDLEPTDTMIAGTDPVAADAFAATLLGLSAAEIPYIGKAAVAGAGTASYELLNPIRVNAA